MTKIPHLSSPHSFFKLKMHQNLQLLTTFCMKMDKKLSASCHQTRVKTRTPCALHCPPHPAWQILDPPLPQTLSLVLKGALHGVKGQGREKKGKGGLVQR